MNALKKFMAGRYGGDQLSFVLLAVSIVLTLAGSFSSLEYLNLLSYVPLFLATFRIFSRKIEKRRLENYKFAILISPIYSSFHKIISRMKGSKTHSYFKCPTCKKSLRVPKGKVKIIVTCPHCNSKFERKS